MQKYRRRNRAFQILGSGAQQHVLVRGEPRDTKWVYKIPRVLWRVDEMFETRRGGSPTSSSILPLRKIVRSARKRADRRAVFRRCLALLQRARGTQAGRCFLSYRVIGGCRAKIVLDGRVVVYRGPMLLQRRADLFFDTPSENIRSFDWQMLVDCTHLLWKQGIGFSVIAETLGPQNWAMCNGSVYLGDTSSITCDLDRIRKVLQTEVVETRVERVLQVTSPSDRGIVGEYFDFVRKEINIFRVEQLWRSDIDAVQT